MDLERRLTEQEQAAADQNQIPSGESDIEDREELGLKPHDPRDDEQQQDARAHREAQPEDPCALSLRLGQAPDENGDENDVVDAEDDLEQRQRRERDPRFRRADPLHRSALTFSDGSTAPKPSQRLAAEISSSTDAS